jgi:hypothetical protein
MGPAENFPQLPGCTIKDVSQTIPRTLKASPSATLLDQLAAKKTDRR